jgi:uncharacterized protein (TIGR03435 family)
MNIKSNAGALFVICVACFNAYAQALPAPATLQFDVASVKQSRGQTDNSKISSADPARFVATNMPLRFLIHHAYHILDYQLVGLPDWTDDIGYDIVGAYAPGPTPSEQETRVMLQNLLVERFGLKTHRDQRDLPVYNLMLARKDGRLGKQIQHSALDCANWPAGRAKTDAGGPSPVTPSGKRPACMITATRRFISGGSRTMADFATTLGAMVRRPVIDRTGLTGPFDIDVQWSPTSFDSAASDAAAGANTSGADGSSIFTAIQEQLGLKLTPGRQTFDVLVIDALNRPAAN